MVSGWILVKPQFQDSYEINRLIEEFKNHELGVRIIDPNVNMINKYQNQLWRN